MYVTVTWDRDNEIMFQRELAGEDILDCDIYANEAAEMYGFNINNSDGYCPVGLCDFTVELADEPQTAVCWTTKSYFIAPE